MKNVLVIGAGRFGRYTCEKLHELGHQVMLVDKDEDRINKALEYVTGAEIGDSTDRMFMESLGVKDYDLCIVAIGDDFLSSLETTFCWKNLAQRKPSPGLPAAHRKSFSFTTVRTPLYSRNVSWAAGPRSGSARKVFTTILN